MTGFVADASVAIAWAVESQADEGTERLKESFIEGSEVVVPALWTLEIANTLLVLMRRARLTRSQWNTIRSEFAGLPVTTDTEASGLALQRISELASGQSLTIYDAAYLELAMRRGLPLASRDSALNKAAKKCHVPTLLGVA